MKYKTDLTTQNIQYVLGYTQCNQEDDTIQVDDKTVKQDRSNIY